MKTKSSSRNQTCGPVIPEQWSTNSNCKFRYIYIIGCAGQDKVNLEIFLLHFTSMKLNSELTDNPNLWWNIIIFHFRYTIFLYCKFSSSPYPNLHAHQIIHNLWLLLINRLCSSVSKALLWNRRATGLIPAGLPSVAFFTTVPS
jgi:hypothetical protein